VRPAGGGEGRDRRDTSQGRQRPGKNGERARIGYNYRGKTGAGKGELVRLGLFLGTEETGKEEKRRVPFLFSSG